MESKSNFPVPSDKDVSESLINLMIVIEYDGRNYFGWQKQKDKITIQGVIEEALSKLFPQDRINLIGAGRTDTGVSAVFQCANFKVSRKHFARYNDLLYRLNSILPEDIAITKLKQVSDSFHARYSALSRTYKYFYTLRKRAIDADRYYYVKTSFDPEKTKDFLNLINGYHSFKSFCKTKNDRHDFKCHVFSVNLRKLKDNAFEFEITANRFLHSMVRSIAGTLLKLASGELSFIEVQKRFINLEPIGIQYLPAKPLLLYKINY